MRRQKKDVTGRIKRHRKLILELLLAAHCRDCTTCVKSGECNLQRLAHRLGVTQIRFENTRPPREIDNSSPAIIRDPNKCILCGDCIRACEELQGIGALGFAFRGTDAIKEFSFPYEGTELKICVVSGLANAREVMERVKRGEAQYHLIEVMACRRGCIMGGGQPPFAGIRTKAARAKGIYSADNMSIIKKPDENPMIMALYDGLLKGKTHELLHNSSY